VKQMGKKGKKETSRQCLSRISKNFERSAGEKEGERSDGSEKRKSGEEILRIEGKKSVIGREKLRWGP